MGKSYNMGGSDGAGRTNDLALQAVTNQNGAPGATVTPQSSPAAKPVKEKEEKVGIMDLVRLI